MRQAAALAVLAVLGWGAAPIAAAGMERVCAFDEPSKVVPDPIAALKQAIRGHCFPGDPILLPSASSSLSALAVATFCDFDRQILSTPRGVVCVLAAERENLLLNPTP